MGDWRASGPLEPSTAAATALRITPSPSAVSAPSPPQVKEYLGSAAFSKAVQCLDLHTGEMVCIKIIKNNKDFFDQSLDEIKLLRYLRRHDPNDEHHVLRM